MDVRLWMHGDGELLGAGAVQRDDGVVRVLRGVVGGGLLGACGAGVRRGRGMRGRWAWGVRGGEVRVLGWVRGTWLRAVL